MKSRNAKHLLSGTVALATVVLASGCATSGSSGSDQADAPTQVAFLSASSANTWLAASRTSMDAAAKKANAKITQFDGKFQPGIQQKQIQDIISSKKYDGLIIASIDGEGIIPALNQATAAGLKVVVLNQVVGKRLDTADPQVDDVSASVLAPPKATGERLGKLTTLACEGVSPCDVVYLFGAKGTPYDTAVRDGYDEVVSATPGIKVVAEGEGGFLGTDEPRKAVQDILQAHPKFDVLVGTADQQVRGGLLALKDAGKSDVKTIGVGGSEPALKAIADGTWFGDVAGAPLDEGRIAFDALLAAIADGKVTGGVDVTSDLPDGGLITKQNVSEFTAQWKG